MEPESPALQAILYQLSFQGSLVDASVQNSATSAGDIRAVGSIHGSRSPGGGHGNPFQYSCLENPLDRGAWQDRAWGLKELDMTGMT